MKAKVAIAAILPWVWMLAAGLAPLNAQQSAQGSVPVLKARISGHGSRYLKVTLPGGEICKGTLTEVEVSQIRAAGVTTAADIAATGTDAGIVAIGAPRVEQAPKCTRMVAGEPPRCDVGAVGLKAWGREFYEEYIQTAWEVEQGTLRGNRGSILHVEIHWQNDSELHPDYGQFYFFGAAVDSKGEVYKLRRTWQ